MGRSSKSAAMDKDKDIDVSTVVVFSLFTQLISVCFIKAICPKEIGWICRLFVFIKI